MHICFDPAAKAARPQLGKDYVAAFLDPPKRKTKRAKEQKTSLLGLSLRCSLFCSLRFFLPITDWKAEGDEGGRGEKRREQKDFSSFF